VDLQRISLKAHRFFKVWRPYSSDSELIV